MKIFINVLFLVITFNCFTTLFSTSTAQVPGEEVGFNYRLELKEIEIENAKPIHSYAFGQYNGRFLLVGGRIDGLHARQPFAAFPLAYNNRELIVLDPDLGLSWSASIDVLSIPIKEQLQSTNMNFYQFADTLIISGGYAFSETANNHITFPKLTTIIISEVIESIIDGNLKTEAIKQTEHSSFAVTGGQMGYLNDMLILVGGNTFTGRYNPTGNPTYTQTYTPDILRFTVNNSTDEPIIQLQDLVSDSEHLRRRDYNLVPYQFIDGRAGYLISAGVFKSGVNLPYLYPVEIDADGYYPVEDFEQLLSHYHSPKVSFYDEQTKELNMIFFGGLAQYFFDGNQLIQDNRVPFVDTISRIKRTINGAFSEFVLPIKMPGLKGTNSEFIPNTHLPRNETGVFLIDKESPPSMLLGHIVGGINTPEANPFSFNRVEVTSGSAEIYEVWLEKIIDSQIPVEKPLEIKLNQNYPNPFNPTTNISYVLPTEGDVSLTVYSVLGEKIKTIDSGYKSTGMHTAHFDGTGLASGLYIYSLTSGYETRTLKMMLIQ